MKNKQIKYIVLVLLAGVTGFVIYSQEFSERLQTPEARARLRALRLWQQAHPEAQPVSEQIKGKVAEYISWIRKKIFGQILGPSQSQGYLSIITLEAAIEQINRSTRGTGITTEQIEELKPLITELIGKEQRYEWQVAFALQIVLGKVFLNGISLTIDQLLRRVNKRNNFDNPGG